MFRNRNWFGKNMWKPKNLHSLEHLKYLYNVLSKNQVVSESNRCLLVETLRSIAEILIWGDQNDSSVFDFFLEKNMLSFFLKILKQKCGSYVCVQLLQTLNILFENIRNETSLYYLLSNNHVNSIIVHKFDFSDEEVMAYYISFLKTLSLKLNCHTIHFFYNEHTNDFPLYTEAIKFFNHSESMVRIAVRTLTLNVYRVRDKSMLTFIRDKTAVPYFSNLVWFIGNHLRELDSCVKSDFSRQGQNRLSDIVAEHLDDLHYMNDILLLNIEDLNGVLIEHLFNKLFVRLYVTSLIPNKSIKDGIVKHEDCNNSNTLSIPLSLYLLSHVFLVIHHEQLVFQLANLLTKNHAGCPSNSADDYYYLINSNITDEQKQQILSKEINVGTCLETINNSLNCDDSDYCALFALCLLYAISTNKSINEEILTRVFRLENTEQFSYNSHLIDSLISIISMACESGCRVRLVTLELAIILLKRIVITKDGNSLLLDEHFAMIINTKEQSISLIRSFYKDNDMFLDMFENEYYEMNKKQLNVEYLLMDSNMLLQPTGTPMTGVEFIKRLPCEEIERTRRAIRVFLLIRHFVLILSNETETELPLTDRTTCIPVGTSLDLNNSDLITCTVISKDGTKTRRFLAMESSQLILVEPHSRLLGWGVTKLAGFLHDIDVVGDKEESKCLHVKIHHTNTGAEYSAKFLFDDHIRCMAAKQKLMKGRTRARKKKMNQIAKLLELPVTIPGNTKSQPQGTTSYSALTARHQSASSLLYGPCFRQPVSRCVSDTPPLTSYLPGEVIASGSNLHVQEPVKSNQDYQLMSDSQLLLSDLNSSTSSKRNLSY